MDRSCRLGPPRVSRRAIPRGYAGALTTTRYIARLIREGARDLCVRNQAIRILRANEVGPKDFLGEVLALFHWVRAHIRYTRDIHRVELLHSARRMLSFRAGDCDDMVILLGAMLEAIGHPVRLVLVGSNPRRPRLFSHIYLEVQVRGRWIALDPTMDRPPGWAPKAVTKKVVPIRRPRAERKLSPDRPPDPALQAWRLGPGRPR